jgi:hypothetical protein
LAIAQNKASTTTKADDENDEVVGENVDETNEDEIEQDG